MVDRIASAGVCRMTDGQREELSRKNAEQNKRSQDDARLRGGGR